ncbi:TadE/TadG family type IV pilus assembly protein [Pseudobutyrivibrio xylanivorans]|uniref:Pilus assembly protein n=1 Tax=Pseudobutyrivibrio xylanivorans TaxID=185007 RepID=A0A5P6VT75_PSEXY|nr:TadE family protein [Pseudobutyrivibrio xylanivorans]QFJ54071.1 pilus assembly protein [Pseudobutyrivibrio xylanivorans]
MSLGKKLYNTNSFAPNWRSKLPVAPVTINKEHEYRKDRCIHGQPPVYKRFINSLKVQEMPFYASSKKASYTIEAAVILPLFISMMVFGLFMFRLLQVQSGVQQAIDYASRTMAITLGNMSNYGESDKDEDISGQEPTIGGEVSEAVLLASTIALSGVEIAKNEVPIGFVDGGALGFDFFDTTVEGNYIDIRVNYQMTFPVGLLGHYSFDVSQRARNRKWVGYDKSENTTDARYVYVTEKGEVYHTNYNCTYLNPSVHRLPKGELSEARNKSGGVYNVCERCKGKDAHGFIFVTDYGTAYHKDINCTEIKHNIKKVLYEDVKDSMRACSKCSAGEKN